MNSHAFCISIYDKVFKFRKWFKYGLRPKSSEAARPEGAEGTKAPKAARPEGAEALSPGQRPGYNGSQQGAL